MFIFLQLYTFFCENIMYFCLNKHKMQYSNINIFDTGVVFSGGSERHSVLCNLRWELQLPSEYVAG